MIELPMHRDLFPITRNLVYFNHAAVGPLSVRAYEAMERHARDQREFGALHWRDWYAEYDRLREAAARLLGAADPREVAILKNTSEGLSFVAEGFGWEEGDNVVTTALEFPSNWTPWKRLERRGVEVRVATEVTADFIERLIDDNTRVVTVSSVAFHNGFAADLDAIGALCARRGVLFCVDAIQSLGVLPIDVRRANIAFLAADGHKWMCGPEGAAIFYVAAEHREKVEPPEIGWTNVQRRGSFLDAGIELVPDGRRYEAGSLNTNGIYGLRAAIELLLEIGIDAIAAEAVRITSLLADGLEELGLKLGAGRPVRSSIIGATPPVVDGRELLRLHGELEKRGVVCAPREGLLRFSPHFYNDESDVGRVLDALRTLTGS
ncbi:MAG TPA: aminotransferase class V-fold PLP-dependent enzyme [Thermoanaerobaculia bacterium]|nr:aminotransferase class V-fold PLP-dependent enzyme [Thermoanaerobaculia bacterium]